MMRENIVQTAQTVASGERSLIEYDWYAGGIPPNVRLGENVYLDTSYGFAAFHSEREAGFSLGEASGVYDRASFVVGKDGAVEVGSYTVLNGTIIICNERVTIGSHCLLAWGSVITDTWASFETAPVEKRREILRFAAKDAVRSLLPIDTARHVVLEDNVWVGFDSVILPGVTLGQGCIIGCKTIISEDVPSYTVMVGNPARPVRRLEPDDTNDARNHAFLEYTR